MLTPRMRGVAPPADDRVDPSRAALIASVIDLVKHDRNFRAQLQRDPVSTLEARGLRLRDSEWAGLRHLLLV